MKDKSLLMDLFLKAGLVKLAWKIRRLYVPVNSDALVLDIGSGGNPYPRANVLLDAYEETTERNWSPLITDRPMAMGFAENLPFKDNAFDFVVLSHVLEHSKDPAKLFSELTRVAKAGYIETPDALFEKICPYSCHRLEITNDNNKLYICHKSESVSDKKMFFLFRRIRNSDTINTILSDSPFDFHMRYYWKDKIEYEIENPDTVFKGDESLYDTPVALTFKQRLAEFINGIIRKIFSQNRRNKKINIYDLVMCPKCKSEDLLKKETHLVCQSCQTEYEIKNNIPFMMESDEKNS